MNKEQTKNIVELWNEVGERPSYMNDEESPYYPHRRRLTLVLQDILNREFSSRMCRSEFGYEVKLTEKSLTGSETPCHHLYDEYSSITLNDFRSNFDWEEEYKVYISYPYTVETYVSESFKSLSKEDVREMMSGSETDLEGNHDPLDCDEHGVVELDVEHVEHSYQVWVNNFRLKESVVEKTNVSGT